MTDKTDLSLAELKDILDDNEMDLSARGLKTVPKALMQVHRATDIDFGSNRIVSLPAELCNMTKIVRLELGSNRLVVLPDNFGNLVNLQHLDLYNNQIEELPVSFANLRSLKWLDLKRNPLEPNTLKAVGNCGSEKECKQAAVNAVGYMTYVKKNIDDNLAKQEKALQKIQAKKAETNRKLNKQKKDAAQKAKEEAAAARRKEAPPQGKSSSNGKAAKEHKTQPRGGEKKAMEAKSCSCIGSMLRFIIRWSFFLSVCIVSGATVSILMNCVEGGSKIPSSKPLCADLTRLTEFKKPSDKFLTNVKTTYSTVFNNYKRLATPYWNTVSTTTKQYYRKAVKTDVGKQAEKYFFVAHSFVVEKALLIHRFALQQWAALNKWYARDGHKMFGSAVAQVKVVAGIVYEVAKDVVHMAADALSVLYHRTETFLVQWQEKGFSKALETVI